MAKKSASEEQEVIIAIKGFNANLTCRGYQFKEGETFKHEGKVEACKGGFHAIEGHPLEVFGYYPPAGSVYHEVGMRGPFSRHSEDSKIAAGEITIRGEVKIPELVTRAIKWVMDRANTEEGGHATGTQGAASATGTRGAASATGDQGAAMAPGKDGRVMGAEGVVLFAVERGDWDGEGYPAISTASGIVGQDGIEPNVWYQAKGGNLVEVEDE